MYLSSCSKLSSIWLTLVLGFVLITGHSGFAQIHIGADSLLADGIPLRTGWRWHSGNNPAWANPSFDDSRWDTIRPSRSINRLGRFNHEPIGWFRLAFTLDSTSARIPLAAVINQVGASELYIDGVLWLRLGRVGSTYSEQEAYIPIARKIYSLPQLTAGRHVLAVRLSQQRPPWYIPKLMYSNYAVFKINLFSAQHITDEVSKQVYIQAIGNYLLVGIFLMLSVIHFMYYTYRRKRVNLVFGLTLLAGAFCVTFIELLGLVSNTTLGEWVILVQGVLISLFMFMLLVTYYEYLGQPTSWFLKTVALLLFAPRLIVYVFEPSNVTAILSIISIIALFADGIRVNIEAIRAHRTNARFMLTSILVMIMILIVGGAVSGWLSSRYLDYALYANSLTNLLFFLTLPISFAIILAREHAQTNRNLEDRLVEVEQLSTEKQAILTAQNSFLEQQVNERTAELTRSLTDLRETQQQLIQREKMASLGELTAGIAHEIQNPLNFVNNFAEVSSELVQEIKEERRNESRDEELEAEILGDLEQNLEKISHHGGRASSIVRAMLEHSRISTGQREPTDLNELANEYLRLSYHGLLAKDKNFNVHLVTQFDPTISTVTLVAQDVGRVFLNLFNNAFYAVQERQRTAPVGYQPTLTVSTRQLGEVVEIRVSDNGTGIPESIQRKVFQPFFTTKPTGQGTGLGLSLSYDIITKGHGGEFTLETTTSEGTTFLIRLPTSQKSI
ncbi:histidine kinase [Spirosoma sp. HMF4905]|uniref:histidine kinase n=2 Tax=Spirosoma arboris TaxID=2682092 RepID=A0A7K1S9E5_9BACT|nr:histidine kinase [Spirosoma arboris]